ncbi:MAG: VWA domain-containing protein [Acidobacteria bacterium]|nr:VWA domain-containing protein [Acidobacteriota bacterium]
MKTLLALIITAACGLGFIAQAQSRRTPPSQSNEKPNQRDRVIEPSPTPTPAEEDAEPDDGEVISIDTKLVSIPVRILDRKNRFIGGLSKENFSIYEDNIEQDLAYFTNEAQPFTVALVLDMSYSATFKIEDIQSAAMAFVAQLRPEDQVMVISFDEQVHVHCEATTDRKSIYSAIRSTKIATGTSLYEAVDTTMNSRMRSIKGRKAIVLFTDGVDTTSRTSHDLDNLRDAMELDALIYPVRYDTYADVQAMKRNPTLNVPPGILVPDSPSTRIPPGTPGTLPAQFPFPIPTTRNPGSSRTPDPRGTRPDERDDRDDPSGLPPTRPPIAMPGQRGTTADEYRFAEEYLNQLALRTGGRVHLASSYGNLVTAFAKIASELREFYSIGYYPKDDGEPGKTRRIKVRVNQENMVVRARDSYVVAKNEKRKPAIIR